MFRRPYFKQQVVYKYFRSSDNEQILLYQYRTDLSLIGLDLDLLGCRERLDCCGLGLGARLDFPTEFGVLLGG